MKLDSYFSFSFFFFLLIFKSKTQNKIKKREKKIGKKMMVGIGSFCSDIRYDATQTRIRVFDGRDIGICGKKI